MDTSAKRRVVITGIGLVTPLGADRETSWRRLHQGDSGACWLDETRMPPQTIAERQRAAGAPAALLLEDVAEDVDPVIRLALHAADEAVDDSRLDLSVENRERLGCTVATSKGGLRSIVALMQSHGEQDSSERAANLWQQFQPSAAAVELARRYAFLGPTISPVAACATGLASVARGADLIRDGCCDVVLAGSADASLSPAVLASFQRMGVLARNFDDPAAATRPFDRDRNGFLVGEGAAVLVLESLQHARNRGTRDYGQWLACGMASDPSGLTQLDDEATALSRLLRDVLHRGGVPASEIDYANLHGTATVANDVYETRALHRALGSQAKAVSCSSIKGAVGHLLGAAGSVELATTLLAMRDNLVPPTINLAHPDPQCDLDYTPGIARPRRIETALKVSLGFGGHLIAALVRKA